MSLVAKYGLDKFVSALYYKDPAHRFIELGKLGFNQLLLVAKHFGVKEIYRKDDPEIIVDINELIEMDLLQREVKIANRLTIESLQKENMIDIFAHMQKSSKAAA